jgi:DNA-binding transcriptional LysR family regulator
LFEDIRTILSGIKRVLQLPAPFDPMFSARSFRIACPISAKTLSGVMSEIQHTAPNINIEWMGAPSKIYTAVAEGLLGLARLGGDRRLPDGVDEAEIPPMKFMGFVRAGHPAMSKWGLGASNGQGHIKVAINNEAHSPVDEAAPETETDRRIAAQISEFSAVGPLFAASDLIATLPPEIIAWDMETHGLVPLPAIKPLPPFRACFLWSSRTANDPAQVWARELVFGAYHAAHAEAEALANIRLLSGQT